MPPAGVRASGNETNDRRPFEARFVCLLHPLLDLATIRWVHPACAFPPLLKAVLVRREIPLALGVARLGCKSQSKIAAVGGG